MSATPSQSNNTHTQRQSLEGRLAAYALASGAVLAAADRASADLIYSGPQNVPITANSSYLLDLNGDGVPDFTISQTTSPFLALGVVGSSPGNLIVQQPGSVLKAAALNACDPIPANNSLGSPKLLASNLTGNLKGPFVGAQNKFLGLEFVINGQEHFGWAQLNVNPDLTATIVDYGYESTPGVGIMAGAGIPGLACTPVPEPTSLSLLALGAVGVLAWSRYRKDRAAAAA